MLHNPSSRLLLCLALVSLAACSSKAPIQTTAKVDQSGVIKVHPGLLGKPVPPELQQESEDPRRVATVKVDERSLPTQPAEATKQQREVYFDFNEAVIKPSYEPLLQVHGRHLAQNPKARVRIEGHADERGPEGLNKRLGAQRAEAVKQILIAQGATLRQVRTASYGELRPKVPGHDESSWAENRRAEIVYEANE